MKLLIKLFFLIFCYSCSKQTNITTNLNNQKIKITSEGMSFVPSHVECSIGDTIFFELNSYHNAVEVSQETYANNQSEILMGGFNIDFGEDTFIVVNHSKTYYYLCQPHIDEGMKGIIFVD
tara:strand:- start:6807 stop:7169 length:363 start_codon:yes stop_codon:yes gene_type:complete